MKLPDLSKKEDEYKRPILVVRVSTGTYMRGKSICITKTLTPLVRKSTLGIHDVFSDIEEDVIVNLDSVYDGLYTVDALVDYDEFGNVDNCEYYLNPYKEKKDG